MINSLRKLIGLLSQKTKQAFAQRVQDSNARDENLNGPLPVIVNEPSRPANIPREVIDLVADFVFLLDEIDSALVRAPQPAIAHLRFVREQIASKLGIHGVEVIQDKQWNPQRQRAVKVESSSKDQKEVKVLQSVSCGYAINGKILKKEEVIISEPTKS